MKKFLRVTGVVLLSLLILALILFLLARFFYRQQVTDYMNGLVQAERCALLRDAGPYATESGQDVRFRYVQDSARARQIRDYFRLDTLLSQGASTWDRTVALATFVARHVPHANQKVYPKQSNAIDLWEYTREVEPAFNCRLHSIMLHELLLASGITNRFVTCFPADSLDSDCHVVNIVWLPKQRKWAMIDSDEQAYLTAPDNGTPLSLEQMRHRFVAGEPIEIHWLLDKRNEASYLAYWPKNLYWFQCWEETGYGVEPNARGRMVALLPTGFDGFWLKATDAKTHDPACFWAAPEAGDE